MKEITIDNVKARISKLQSRGNAEYSLGLTLNEEFELACLRQLVASLEAEAVADVVAWSSPNEERTCDIRMRRHDIKPGSLYTAPPAPVSVMDEAQSRELFEKYCMANIERNKWHPDLYAHLPAREQWAVWEACRAAMLQGAEPSPATDNTAQQFEALATSAPSTPTFTAEELKSFGREMWFDGWRTSRHTPNPNYDCNQAFMGTDVAERLTTSAGSGKQ